MPNHAHDSLRLHPLNWTCPLQCNCCSCQLTRWHVRQVSLLRLSADSVASNAPSSMNTNVWWNSDVWHQWWRPPGNLAKEMMKDSRRWQVFLFNVFLHCLIDSVPRKTSAGFPNDLSTMLEPSLYGGTTVSISGSSHHDDPEATIAFNVSTNQSKEAPPLQCGHQSLCRLFLCRFFLWLFYFHIVDIS